MRIGVFGLWHLGSVVSGCLAEAGFQVVGLDFDQAVVSALKEGRPPLFEPGLEDLIRRGLASGHLGFTGDPAAMSDVDLVWITFDTPVREDDGADVGFVISRVERLFPDLKDLPVLLVSSQLPVGTTAALERACRARFPRGTPRFCYSPENLRLGAALTAFRAPERVVVGLPDGTDRAPLEALFKPFSPRIEWMSVESAEMTKHALNAHLATSVVLSNEIAVLCERTGADAAEVERGLRTDPRIGPKAYVRAGGAFAGGTLARDVVFLKDLARAQGTRADLLAAVLESNEAHADWAWRRLSALLGDLKGVRIALWGLAYKPGTDTLRRSRAVALAERLAGSGADVRAYDPHVRTIPSPLADQVRLVTGARETLEEARALVVATEHEEFRSAAREIRGGGIPLLVLDENGFLDSVLGTVPGIRYLKVGRSA